MKSDSPIIITGATGAIGSELSKMLAAEGTPLIFACRNLSKAAVLKQNIISLYGTTCIEIIELDLSSLDSVKGFAKALKEHLNGRKIAALVNNAGVIAPGFNCTDDGWEMNFGVNYIGVWLLTTLVKPYIANGGRIINVVSCTTWFSKIDAQYVISTKSRNPSDTANQIKHNRLKMYGKAKLALLMATKEMASRYENMYVLGADPGIVDSAMITMGRWFDPLADILFRPFIKSPRKGAIPIYRALTDNRTPLDSKTAIYRGSKTRKSLKKSIAKDPFSKELWRITKEDLSKWI